MNAQTQPDTEVVIPKALVKRMMSITDVSNAFDAADREIVVPAADPKIREAFWDDLLFVALGVLKNQMLTGNSADKKFAIEQIMTLECHRLRHGRRLDGTGSGTKTNEELDAEFKQFFEYDNRPSPPVDPEVAAKRAEEQRQEEHEKRLQAWTREICEQSRVMAKKFDRAADLNRTEARKLLVDVMESTKSTFDNLMDDNELIGAMARATRAKYLKLEAERKAYDDRKASEEQQTPQSEKEAPPQAASHSSVETRRDPHCLPNPGDGSVSPS